MKKISLLLFIGLLSSWLSTAQEAGGMWIPNELNESEMKAMGMKIDAKDIFDPQAASIKDAIAHFGGGCTSEVISPNGLLLTNHHCGYSQIQSHSTVENDYLKEGFWAKDYSEELPNKGLTATFIVDIQEVTDKILQGVSGDMNEEDRQDLIKDNIEIVNKNIIKEAYQDSFIRAFYKGNKYYLFITETYKDIRLVGAPPSSIGKYGADTDNWSWPRHVGDFSLFRIYADKNNKPAEYSEDNVPYQPKHFLPISIKGVEQDDFTFVFGFPGMTDEYLPASALTQILEITNPSQIGIRDVALKILDAKMRNDNATRIKYASKYAGISNYHKKWTGESLGLKKSKAVEKRRAYEKKFLKEIAKKENLLEQYGKLLPKMDSLYQANNDYQLAEVYFNEAIYRNSESFRIALLLNNFLDAVEDPATDQESLNAYKKKIKGYFKGIYKNYEADLDEEVSLALIDLYQKDVPSKFLPNSKITVDAEAFKNSIITGKKAINGAKMTEDIEKAMADDEALIKALKTDALVQEIRKIRQAYESTVSSQFLANKKQLNQLQRTYMKAQMEVFPDKKFFPDANSTLRVTYGKVDGYQPEDRDERYEPVTYLDEAVEKYIPGDYEFDMPKKLRKLEKKRQYGKYGEGKGKKAKMPVNFIATNHTTGGNSGSPTLDKDGNLIGLNFDRVWEGTMSDLNYDPEICRNIMVDARYILFVIDKYAKASYLLDEMEIVE